MISPIFENLEKQSGYLSLRRGLRTRLSKLQSSDELVQFLLGYTRFNRIFAGCVLGLASQFHLSHLQFGDANSARIASNILAAAEDEYVEYASKTRTTHRELSKGFIKSTLKFFKLPAEALPLSSSVFLEFDELIKKGYCIKLHVEDGDLFSALGFHMASELSGSEEFRSIDSYLHMNYLELVENLCNTPLPSGHKAYFWIETHTSVEEVHFKYAQLAVKEALHNYRGKLSLNEIEKSLMAGFEYFFTETNRFLCTEI